MNTIRLESLGSGRWALHTKYHEKFPALAKKFPGFTWNKDARYWVGYSDGIELLLPTLQADGICRLAGEGPPLRVPLSVKLDHPSLRDYQKQGVNFLIDTMQEGCLLADSMGLGKTATSLIAITKTNDLPAVIVCPNSVKKGWVDEGKRLGIDVHALYGTSIPDNTVINKSDGIIVLNYEILDAWLPCLKNVKTVVFDEGQTLSNEKSKRSKACKVLASKAKNRTVMTGTPIQNFPRELFNIVDTVSPGRFGSWLSYMKRYAGAFQEDVPVRGGDEGETQKVWNTKGSSHTDELHNRLKHFMLRRTKQDVSLELPSKTRVLREIDVSKEYRNPDRWWSLENKSQAQIALNLAAEGKIEASVELALEALKGDSNIIIWMHHKEIAKALRKKFLALGIEPFMLTGDETTSKRQDNAEQAKNKGNSICIATVEAVGTGVNYLSFADIAIFVELHYVPGKLLQAEDRHHRQGAIKPITIYYLIAMETIDERIRDVVLSKLRTSESIIGDIGGTFSEDLMNEEKALDELRRALAEEVE